MAAKSTATPTKPQKAARKRAPAKTPTSEAPQTTPAPWDYDFLELAPEVVAPEPEPPEVVAPEPQPAEQPPAARPFWSRFRLGWSRRKADVALEPALVFGNRRYGVEYIAVEDIPEDATTWHYGGQWVYLLERRDGVLQSVHLQMMVEAAKEDAIPPDRLYRALNWKEVEILFKIPEGLLEKLNLALTILLIGILLFFCFLVYSTITGP